MFHPYSRDAQLFPGIPPSTPLKLHARVSLTPPQPLTGKGAGMFIARSYLSELEGGCRVTRSHFHNSAVRIRQQRRPRRALVRLSLSLFPFISSPLSSFSLFILSPYFSFSPLSLSPCRTWFSYSYSPSPLVYSLFRCLRAYRFVSAFVFDRFPR